MKDYSLFFTDIISIHLHNLVKLVQSSKRKKILVHRWILGIEYSWSEYIDVSEENSEFIARLSFWIGGLRDKFNSKPKKSQVIKLLNQTFDASTFCFFEYGAKEDILKQIRKYTREVDNFFKEDILTHKLKKFELSQKIVQVVNKAFKKLIELGVKQNKIENINISKEINTASDLEKEFNKLIETIIKLSLDSKTVSKESILDFLEEFLEECKKLNYNKPIFYLKIFNLFLIPLNDLEVSIKMKKKRIKSKTNESGEIIFMDIPKGEIKITFFYKKEREYIFNINKQFNKKDIWLFSI